MIQTVSYKHTKCTVIQSDFSTTAIYVIVLQ